MKAAIYARYSSHEQDGSSTIESQLRECEDYILKRKWEIDHRYIFIDRAVSGSSADGRDAFKSMVAHAKKHPCPFQRIVVWKFSRFARDRESSAIYKGLLRRCGVDIISVSEPVDRSSASGVLTEGMYEVIDQFYSARLGEEVHRGMKETALQGLACGGIPPFGYVRSEIPDPLAKKDRKGNLVVRVKWEIHEEKAWIVGLIFDEYLKGNGLKKIAKELNNKGVMSYRGHSWDPSAIRAILNNEAYLDWRVWNKTRKIKLPNGKRTKRERPKADWVIKKNSHPPIVSEETWKKIHKRMDEIRSLYGAKIKDLARSKIAYSKYLLTGLIKCSEGGANFIIN